MNIYGKKKLNILFFCLHAPYPRPVFEIRLIVGVGKSVHYFKSDAHTTIIGYVFTDDELTVDFTAVVFNAVKLSDHVFCKVVERFEIVFSPPVFQIAPFIEFCAVVVECVRYLMTDNCSDSAEVFADALFNGVERLLENSSGKSDIIAVRIVAGVYHMSRHSPLGAVDRFKQSV